MAVNVPGALLYQTGVVPPLIEADKTAGSETVTELDAGEVQPLLSIATTEYVLGANEVNDVLLW